VVENKAEEQTSVGRAQGVEQLFGNANSLRAPFGLYDEGDVSTFFDIANFPSMERTTNRRGDRNSLQAQYGETPIYAFHAGTPNDIASATRQMLENRIRRAHSIIWAGGKRDPLTAFDEWSKLLFAKVSDERRTPNGTPRTFQVGTKETTAAVATRIHQRFAQACAQDPSVF
jgi:type I restriction enzyme M protein